MTMKLWIVAAIVAASSLLLDTNQADAQGRRNWRNRGSSYTQTNQLMNYPANRGYLVVGPRVRVGNYGLSSDYSVGYGYANSYGYRYPSQYGYRSSYGGYSYPSRSGISIGIGGFANRGYRGFGN